MKLTWDEDDPERNQITRKTFTRKEVEENDFKAYIASSSEPEDEEEVPSKGKASRDKLRELLLAGNDDTLPEGWGDGQDADDADVDMEVTFTPGLSVAKEDKDETTLEKYQRKAREKKKKRKEERKVKATDTRLEGEDDEIKDDFFGADSNEDEGDEGGDDGANAHPTRSLKHGKKPETLLSESEPRRVSTTEELALIADADNLSGEPRHFSMKAVLKAEKAKGNKKKDKKKKVKYIGGEDEVQEDFSIDVKDDRFKAVHEDSTFAIDPSNPQYDSDSFVCTQLLTLSSSFKKTKSMSALLEEGSNRRRERYENTGRKSAIRGSSDQLQSLVESVKRKSASTGKPGIGKRRKL